MLSPENAGYSTGNRPIGTVRSGWKGLLKRGKIVETVKKERLYYGWIVVVAGFVIMATSFGIRYTYGVFFKSLEQNFGWTRTLTSGVFSFYMLFCALFAVCGGWALDRYGPRMVLVIMGLFISSSLFLSSQADSLWKLFVSYSLLLAIGTGPTYAVVMATVSRWFVRRRGTALAIVGAGIGVGILIMNPVAAYLVSRYGWQTAYFIIGLIALLTIIPCSLLIKRTPNETEGSPAAKELGAQSGEKAEDFSLIEAAKSKNFWLFFFIWFLYSVCVHLVLTHLVPYAIDLGVPTFSAAGIVTLLGGSSIVGRLAIGRVSDSIGRKGAATLSALLMAGAMLLLSGASNLRMLQLFAVIFGFFYGALDPPILAFIGEVFGMRHIGVIMGILVTSWSAGAALGPSLGGYLFDTTGSYFSAFLAGMVMNLVVSVLCLLVTVQKEPDRDRSLESS